MHIAQLIGVYYSFTIFDIIVRQIFGFVVKG